MELYVAAEKGDCCGVKAELEKENNLLEVSLKE